MERERVWTIRMALPGATPDDWLSSVQMSGPPVRPGDTVEVVDAVAHREAVEALREIRDEADSTPWYDAGEGLAEIVAIVDRIIGGR